MLYSLQKYRNTNTCVLYPYLCTIFLPVYHIHICVLFAQAILPYCYTSAVIWVLVTFILLDLAKAFVNALFITEILEYQYLCSVSILVYYLHKEFCLIVTHLLLFGFWFILLDLAKAFVNGLFITEKQEYPYLSTIYLCTFPVIV